MKRNYYNYMVSKRKQGGKKTNNTIPVFTMDCRTTIITETHTDTDTDTGTDTHTHTHTQRHACTHARMHAGVHTHTHTNTHSLKTYR